MLGVFGTPEASAFTVRLGVVNGELAVLTMTDEGIDSVLFVTVEGEQITALHAIRNPEKLTAVGVDRP